jgi:hypothetical protein
MTDRVLTDLPTCREFAFTGVALSKPRQRWQGIARFQSQNSLRQHAKLGLETREFMNKVLLLRQNLIKQSRIANPLGFDVTS